MQASVRRILLLNTDLEIGGTPTVVRELAKRLSEPGKTEVEVACLAKWGPMADQIKAAGIHVTALNARGVFDLLATTSRLIALIKERKYDTVLSFLIHANFIASRAQKKLPGVRFFQSVQTTQPNPKWHWWLQGKIQKSAEKLIAPSHAIVRATHERSHIDPSRFVVIPNAVDPGDFPRANIFSHKQIRVGFLGRIDPVKRLDVAMCAVVNLNRDDIALHIFGDGEKRNKLQLWQETNHPDPDKKRFVWHGSVPRPQIALSQIDMLVLPSIGEGFPMVLIEALASGVPCIGSDWGGIPEIIEHEKTGLIVPMRGSEFYGFAEAIRRYIEDTQLRNQIIENGIAYVRENLTWDSILPKYRDVLGIKST